MSIEEFIALVNDSDTMMSQYPQFLMIYVIPNKKAFLQAIFEVDIPGLEIGTKTFRLNDWMSDSYRRQQGWPQAIEMTYNVFIKEYYNG